MTAPDPAATTALAPLPSVYNVDGKWELGLQSWTAGKSAYANVNAQKYREILTQPEAGPRVVVNMASWTLLQFLITGTHLNSYQLPRIGGAPAPGPGLREDVDALITSTLKGVSGKDIHFGAAALESVGIRFYGEYCLVLAEIDPSTQILDRDSYELHFPPLGPVTSSAPYFQMLRGTWQADLVAMAILKARAILVDADRLVTEGRLRDTLLRGEEFIEVHKVGGFAPTDLEEVRQADVDVASQRRILDAATDGVLPSAEELVWLARRSRIERELDRSDIPTRVVDAQAVR
jgi:hypothetical protein